MCTQKERNITRIFHLFVNYIAMNVMKKKKCYQIIQATQLIEVIQLAGE